MELVEEGLGRMQRPGGFNCQDGQGFVDEDGPKAVDLGSGMENYIREVEMEWRQN